MAAKRKQSEEDSTTHWKKVGGFDAFNPQAPLLKKRKMRKSRATGWGSKPKKPKFVKCDELPEPEVGIHTTNRGTERIYEHVIDDWTCGREKGGAITPWKRGSKFHDNEWRAAAKETAALYLLCRQVYVDVVGSGLLYKFREFCFSSPPTMLNYLWVINPRHKDAMRTIQLDLNLGRFIQCFEDEPPRTCGRPFDMIASCKNLQHFTLNIRMNRAHYNVQWEGNYWSNRTARSITVDEKVMKLVSECLALRDIRGLKSFEMLFTPDCFRSTVPPFEEKNQMRLIQVVEEVRKLVTSEAE